MGGHRSSQRGWLLAAAGAVVVVGVILWMTGDEPSLPQTAADVPRATAVRRPPPRRSRVVVEEDAVPRVEDVQDALASAEAQPANDGGVRARLQRHVHEVLEGLVAAKARERADPRAPSSAEGADLSPPRGSLAAARRWLAADMPSQLWDKVGTDLGMSAEEMERCWRERPGRALRSATYGAGSFVVRARARPRAGAPGASPAAPSPESPRAEEDWWERASPAERSGWLVAFFAESSGVFEVVRVGETGEPADAKFRAVEYR